jgi:hypothetical protein
MSFPLHLTYNKNDITVSGNLNKCIQGKLKKHTVQLPLFLPLIMTIIVKIKYLNINVKKLEERINDLLLLII